MNRIERIAALAALLAVAGIAVAVGYRWGSAAVVPEPWAPAPESAIEPRILYWYDPMKPEQHFDQPGKSPFMDMDLVPKYADDGATGAGVRIDPQVRQNLGIRTVVVWRGRLQATMRVPGTVAWNLRDERLLSVPVDAVVERLRVRTPFEAVRAGQPLLTLRSARWSTALAEAEALRSARSGDASALRGAAESRLRALGLPEGSQSDGRGGIVLTAPIAGVLSEIAVREGQTVPAGAPLLRINATRSVWVEASLPADAAADLVEGTRVDVVVDGDATPLAGRIDAVLPQVDAATRTRRARIELGNADGRLSPGQFVQVVVDAATTEALLVPAEAVIDDGVQRRVIVLRDERFVPVAVTTGRSAGGRTEVLSGLSPGERVVASGQFLIDSEANLSGALDRLDDAPATPIEHADHAP